MLEVLISMLLLSLGLFSLDALQLSALRTRHASYTKALAESQLQCLQTELTFLKEQGLDPLRLQRWNERNAALLPKGVGTVPGQFPTYTITVCWAGSTQQRLYSAPFRDSICLSRTLKVV